MDSHIDITIGDTLTKHSNSFFKSIQSHDPVAKLSSVLATLTNLNTTIRDHHHTLHGNTLTAIYGFASLINSMASNMLELERECDSINTETHEDLSKIIEDNMGNLTINGQPDICETKPFPAYIRPAYKWLLENLHNPYPSKATKKSISQETKCSIKDIDAWFTDTRKRIGWNALRKSRFGNKQERIIAAATDILKPKIRSFDTDLGRSLISEMDPNEVHRPHFVSIVRKAKALYAHKFPDLSPSSFADEKLCTPQVIPQNDFPQVVCEDAALVYPTPEPSPPTSPADEIITPAAVSSPSLSLPKSRKRRQMSPDVDDIDRPDLMGPRSKRFRSDVDLFLEVARPSSSGQFDLSHHNDISKSLHQCVDSDSTQSPPSLANSNLKRKRRLSDGDGQGTAKRPHNALCLPRIQTVSNPLPLPSSQVEDVYSESSAQCSISELLSDAIPAPVSAEDPSSRVVPLDIDSGRFDFSTYDLVDYRDEELPDILGVSCVPFSAFHEFDYKCSALANNLVGDFEAVDLQSGFIINEVPPDLYHLESKSETLNPAADFSSPSLDSDLGLDTFGLLSPLHIRAALFNDIASLEERDAKRARAEALREELRQLEAEL